MTVRGESAPVFAAAKICYKLPMDDLEKMAAALEASGRYRILRKLDGRERIETADGSETRLGLFFDVETTGLEPARDEIIEIAMVPFTYALDGRIFELREPLHFFRQPKDPIPPLITRLTGITDAMVAGQSIDLEKVVAQVNAADLIVAHNAQFDRRFAELLCPAFVTKPWACSMAQIDWAMEGFEGTKLAYLVASHGHFYDRHRAVNDCYAAIELLAKTLPSGRRAMSQLLERARRPSWRIWAENAPFDFKDNLKARGYRWNGDGNQNPRAWYKDVEDEARESELSYLRQEIYQREIDLLVKKITAYERFSVRA